MPNKKKALITGISGQDGYFLMNDLVALGYEVFGTTRNLSSIDSKAYVKVRIVETDYSEKSLLEIISRLRPTEIYHLAGQTYVGKSWNLVDESIEASGLISLKILRSILEVDKSIKFLNASSSEIYGESSEKLEEKSLKEPTNPYGCAKLLSHTLTSAYRENYNIFAVNAILFNHESSFRKNDFFSKKLISTVVDIFSNKNDKIQLGNLDVQRDWGASEDYMKAVFLTLQAKSPSDYNICSSSSVSVKDLVEYVFNKLGMNFKDYVVVDTSLVRDKEKKLVIGCNKKIKKELDWEPTSTIFEVLDSMLSHEFKSRGLNEPF